MFYITSTIPYVNGQPHLGHLLEAIFNDTLARYKRRSLTEPVIFSMGLDQHGLKVYRKAEELGLPVQKYVNGESKKFKDLWKKLEITNDVFIETSSSKHRVVSQIFWEKLVKKGFIYKKTYTGLYCVGDEAFVSKGQLRENGMCPNHDELPIEMQEENYFFKLSAFTDQVKDYLKNSDIRPDRVRLEWLNFLEDGLDDISISREKKNLPWGIPVPGDEEQVMYVWFEALLNYLTGLVDEESTDKFLEFPLQKDEFTKEIWDQIEKQLPINTIYLGKDIAKFHLVVWPAMLLAAGLKLTKTNLIHGFINDSLGRKFSKSLGNGVMPSELIEKFGGEGLRFIMNHEMNAIDDTNFDWDRVTASYNANLADNLGNLVVRVSNLVQNYVDGIVVLDAVEDEKQIVDLSQIYLELENYNPQKALQNLFAESTKINQFLEETKPWTLAKDMAKNQERIREILTICVVSLIEIGKAISIFMPETGEKIYQVFSADRISKAPIMFEKKE